MMVRLRLKNGVYICIQETRTEVYLSDARGETSGRVVGTPQRNAEQAATAKSLGYGDDVEAMCRDHDPMHAILACALYGNSKSMQEVAFGVDRGEKADAEEAAVIALQRLCRLHKIDAVELAKRLNVLESIEVEL